MSAEELAQPDPEFLIDALPDFPPASTPVEDAPARGANGEGDLVDGQVAMLALGLPVGAKNYLVRGPRARYREEHGRQQRKRQPGAKNRSECSCSPVAIRHFLPSRLLFPWLNLEDQRPGFKSVARVPHRATSETDIGSPVGARKSLPIVDIAPRCPFRAGAIPRTWNMP